MVGKEILRNLVHFNTVKDKENAQMINYIEKILREQGFQTDYKGRNLVMSIKKEWNLGFLGHMDTVEPGQQWKTNPFQMQEKGGKLYGLGVCDMKGGIAAMLAAVSQMNFENLRKGMKLYFTYDEEIGFSGIKDAIRQEKTFPDTMVFGEPTNNEIMVGSKGLMEYQISFKGEKAHSSTPQKGKSAIRSAIGFMNELQEFYELDVKKEQNPNFEIPYTTMNIGKIQGGSAINSVPDCCEFLVDFKTIDTKAEEKIVQEIAVLKEKYGADVQNLNRLSAFFNPSEISKKTCNFITEASFLKKNCLILGAGPVTAHEVNEYIEEKSLERLVEQYRELIEKMCR